jgi:hypothetical protein
VKFDFSSYDIHTHSAHGSQIVLRCLILLILINPLIEVGLQEVNLLSILQKSWPELFLQLLLSQNKLNGLAGVVGLALFGVNLRIELENYMVCSLEGFGVAVERERLFLNVDLEVFRLDIGDGDCEVDKVLCGFRLIGALSPEDCCTS